MKTESLSSFERDTRRVLRELHTSKTAVILDEKGLPAAFLIDPETYQAEQERLAMFEAVAEGERDFAEGRTLSHEQVKEKMAKWLK